MGSFSLNMKRIGEKIGEGRIKGEVRVDGGARTVPLEVGAWRNFMGRFGPKAIRHYNDGGPHALQKSLQQATALTMRDIAKGLHEEGTLPGMRRHVERVDGLFKRNAPRRTGMYRDSTLLLVRDRGRFAYSKRGRYYGVDPGER